MFDVPPKRTIASSRFRNLYDIRKSKLPPAPFVGLRLFSVPKSIGVYSLIVVFHQYAWDIFMPHYELKHIHTSQRRKNCLSIPLKIYFSCFCCCWCCNFSGVCLFRIRWHGQQHDKKHGKKYGSASDVIIIGRQPVETPPGKKMIHTAKYGSVPTENRPWVPQYLEHRKRENGRVQFNEEKQFDDFSWQKKWKNNINIL